MQRASPEPGDLGLGCEQNVAKPTGIARSPWELQEAGSRDGSQSQVPKEPWEVGGVQGPEGPGRSEFKKPVKAEAMRSC